MTMPRAKWTFMLYMAGDNNLSSAGDADLAELRQVGSTPEVHVVVEFDNAGSQGTRRFHIQQGGKAERVVTLGETDSGQPQTLIDFVVWATTEYPAERYALVLWNHGCGWEPIEIDRIAHQMSAPGYSERESLARASSTLRRTFFRSSLETILSLPSSRERAICSDDGSGHSLDTLELGRVLAAITTHLGRPLDLLGMDACLMSNLEVAFQIQPYAHYMVASEESEPNDGWPYAAVLRTLVTRPTMSTAALAERIVKAYVQDYLDQGYPGAVTQSALNLTQLDTLIAPINALAAILLANMPRSERYLWRAQSRATHFWHYTLWDLAHLCAELARTTRLTAIRQRITALHAKLIQDDQAVILSEAHAGAGLERCGGISIYLPPPVLTRISPYYAELTFAKSSRWLELLRAYHAAA